MRPHLLGQDPNRRSNQAHSLATPQGPRHLNSAPGDCHPSFLSLGFPGGSVVKNPPANAVTQETRVLLLGWEDPQEEQMATHSSNLAWRIPWTEKPGELQSMGSQESDMTEHVRTPPSSGPLCSRSTGVLPMGPSTRDHEWGPRAWSTEAWVCLSPCFPLVVSMHSLGVKTSVSLCFNLLIQRVTRGQEKWVSCSFRVRKGQRLRMVIMPFYNTKPANRDVKTS